MATEPQAEKPKASAPRLTRQQQEYLMREALEEAKRGVAEGEAPIGCVIARPVSDAINRQNSGKAEAAQEPQEPKQQEQNSKEQEPEAQNGAYHEVKIVARGHNRMNGLQSKIAHAEIMAFQSAAGNGTAEPAIPLDSKDAILVSTLEPCVMCLGAAMEAGVALVLFGLKAPADNGTQRVRPPESPESANPQIIGDILAGESRQLFEEWLKGKEGTEQAKFVEQLLALTEG